MRNNRLKGLRVRARMTQADLGKACGIGKAMIGQLESFRTVSPGAREKVAQFFGRSSTWMFPPWMKCITKSRVVRKVGKNELTATQFALLEEHEKTRRLLPSPEESAIESHDQQVAGIVIKAAMNNLKPREKQILELRYGLNGKEEHSLEKLSEMFQVTRERIRQIESKAMRRLRHPTRSEQLKLLYCGLPLYRDPGISRPIDFDAVVLGKEDLGRFNDKIESVIGSKEPE